MSRVNGPATCPTRQRTLPQGRAATPYLTRLLLLLSAWGSLSHLALTELGPPFYTPTPPTFSHCLLCVTPLSIPPGPAPISCEPAPEPSTGHTTTGARLPDAPSMLHKCSLNQGKAGSSLQASEGKKLTRTARGWGKSIPSEGQHVQKQGKLLASQESTRKGPEARQHTARRLFRCGYSAGTHKGTGPGCRLQCLTKVQGGVMGCP